MWESLPNVVKYLIIFILSTLAVKCVDYLVAFLLDWYKIIRHIVVKKIKERKERIEREQEVERLTAESLRKQAEQQLAIDRALQRLKNSNNAN